MDWCQGDTDIATWMLNSSVKDEHKPRSCGVLCFWIHRIMSSDTALSRDDARQYVDIDILVWTRVGKVARDG